MIKNQLADMLTRLKNASLKSHSFVIINYSLLNCSIIKTLILENLVKSYSVIISKTTKFKKIKIELKYFGLWIKKPAFFTLKIRSKTNYIEFSSFKDIIKILKSNIYKSKLIFLSTTEGIMTLNKAQNLKVGGKILFEIN